MTSATEKKQNSIVIETLSGEHLGFTFFHPDLEENSGNCIFMVLPVRAELFDSKEGKFFEKLKDMGEFQWSRIEETITISMKGKKRLLITKEGHAIDPATEAVIGNWKLTKDKKE